jgi:penicillin G amidase
MKCSSQFSAVRIAALFLLLILVASGMAVYWTFHRVVPSMEGIVNIPHLQGEVTVRWDSFQVPHITTQQEADLYAVMGYLHARDRLWQMTRQQYKLEGLHSREIGEAMIDADRFYLTLSFGEVARDAYEELPDEQKRLLQSYSDGVNAFISKHRRHLSSEFALGDVKPLTWKPWHSIGVLMLWSWEHQQSFWAKPALTALHFLNDNGVTSSLTGLDVPDQELFGSDAPGLGRLEWESLLEGYHQFSSPAAPSRTGFAGTGVAVARQRSGPSTVLFHTRESLLVLPDKGYEMALQSGQGWRSGITLPGLPVLLSGQNEHLAWAVMPMLTDDGDFFTGRLFRETPDSPVNWDLDPVILSKLGEKLSVKQHILSMKDGSERQILIKKAHKMPVVAVSQEHNRFLAFDWTGNRNPADIRALMDISGSRNATQLSRIVASLSAPAIQVLFATSDGQTGRLFGGMLPAEPFPLRIKDADSLNGLPSMVHASQTVPDKLHQQGNSVTFLDRLPSFRTSGDKCLFSPPWERSDRLRFLVDMTAHDQLSQDLQLHWHNDTYSVFAAELAPRITGILETAPIAPSPDIPLDVIIPYLKNWNYEFGPNETAATLFQFFFKNAARKLYAPWLSTWQTDLIFRTPSITYSAVARLLSDPELWPGSHPQTYEEWIMASMNESASHLSANYGNEPYDWQWNRVVKSGFSPMLFEESRNSSRPARLAERNLFAMPNMTVSGSPHSINAIHPADNDAFKTAGATTMKRIMLVQPESISHTIISTGQSGNLFSDHYRDQFELWNKGLLKAPVKHASTQNNNIIHTQRFRP